MSRFARTLICLCLAFGLGACTDGADEQSPDKNGGDARPAARDVGEQEAREAAELVEKANAKATNFEYTEAIELYKQALEKDPNNDEAWRGSRLKPISRALAVEASRKAAAASNLAFLGDLVRAYEEFRNAANLDPNVEDYAVKYATATASIRRYHEAQKICQEWLAKDPTNARMTIVAAEASYFSKNWNACLKFLDDMSIVEAGAEKRTDIKRAIAQVYYIKAVAAHKADRPAISIDAIRSALAREPDNVDRRHYLAGVYLEEGKFDEAIAEFKSVLERHPEHPNAPANLAQCYHRSGEADTSIEWYTRAVQRNTQDWESRIALARVYETKGDQKSLLRAVGYLDEAISINPRADDAYFTLDRVHRKLGNTEIANKYQATFRKIKEIIDEQESKIRILSARLRENPDNMEARMMTLEIHKEFHHNKDVMRLAYEILNLDPKHADALYYMSEALRVEGDIRGSYFEALKLIEAHPLDSRGFHMAAWALKDLKQNEAALSYARKGFEMDAGNFGALEVMLEMMRQKGGYEQEIRTYLPLYTRLRRMEEQKLQEMRARDAALQERILGALKDE